MIQAAILRPTTERLLRSTGIGPGMRVLDLDCGAGEVSMLAAELVGPSGSVVGIDRNPNALAVARERAQMAKLRQISFKEASADTYSDPELFDLVIGRCVLIHQANPTPLIRAAAGLTRPGGVVAFHEIGLHAVLRSLPCVPLWQQVGQWVLTAFQAALPHYDASGRLIEHFFRAGLPHPTLFCEIPVGGGEDSPFYAWMTETLRTLLPQLVQKGVVTAEQVEIETLAGRLRTAVTEMRSQICGLPQICAWTRT
jgi:ubiquinone/menaquinone biosynthesis C-methylase UbiE